jgi:hypothetical protein
MFATRKQLSELGKELQRMRLVVDRLRRDMNQAHAQLRGMDGWNDDFIKTQEVSDAQTRMFIRPVATAGGGAPPLREAADPAEAADPSTLPSTDQDSVPRSSIRRRVADR